MWSSRQIRQQKNEEKSEKGNRLSRCMNDLKQDFRGSFSGGRGICKTSKTDSTAFDFFSISGRLSCDNRPRELCIFVI